MKLAALLMTLLSSPLPGSAQSTLPQDFAYGLSLAESAPQAVHALTLPSEVLSALIDDERGDLCIFDATGHTLAHAIATPTLAPDESVLVPLALFPLEARGEPSRGGVAVSVERDAEGTIVRAFAHGTAAARTRVSYLVSADALSEPLEALKLSLEAEHPYTVAVEIEASDDLDAFRFVARATLARLEHEGKRLERDVVLVTPMRARYLRVSLSEPPAGLRLTAVEARVRRGLVEPRREFVELAPRALSARDEQLFLYELRGVYHLDRYAIALPPSTLLIEAALESGPSAEGPFHEVDRAVFRRSPRVERELPATRDRFFRLRVTPKGGGVREGMPTLRVGYVAPRVLFSGEVAGPYLLAYGSARARCRQFQPSELQSLDGATIPRADTVRITARRVLGGESARVMRAPERPTRVYVLWGVLVLSVVMLALFARRLLQKV